MRGDPSAMASMHVTTPRLEIPPDAGCKPSSSFLSLLLLSLKQLGRGASSGSAMVGIEASGSTTDIGPFNFDVRGCVVVKLLGPSQAYRIGNLSFVGSCTLGTGRRGGTARD